MPLDSEVTAWQRRAAALPTLLIVLGAGRAATRSSAAYLPLSELAQRRPPHRVRPDQPGLHPPAVADRQPGGGGKGGRRHIGEPGQDLPLAKSPQV